MNDILEKFKHHATKASYHYADDSGKEWKMADKERNKAKEIYNAYPELHTDMRLIMNDQLWRI